MKHYAHRPLHTISKMHNCVASDTTGEKQTCKNNCKQPLNIILYSNRINTLLSEDTIKNRIVFIIIFNNVVCCKDEK